MKMIISFFILLSVPAIYGQSNNELLNSGYSRTTFITFDHRYKGVAGSPLLFPEFVSGKIVIEEDGNKKVFQDKISVNIDLFEGFVYVKPVESTQMINMQTDPTEIILFNSDSIRYQRFQIQSKIHYGRILSPENMTRQFIQIFHVNFLEADFKGAYSSGREYDEYIRDDQYYWHQNGIWERAKMTKKYWIKQFPRKKATIQRLGKESKVLTAEQVIDLLRSI